MRGLWRWVAERWDRFWFRPTDGLPLGLTRVGIGFAAFVSWVGTAPLLRHYYTDQGEFPIEAARVWSAEYVARFAMPDILASYPAVLALYVAWGVALAALIVGWRTRLFAWLHWLLYLWFFFRNPTFVNGGDEVLRLTSLYLALAYTVVAPGDRALSLDRRRWKASAVDEGGEGRAVSATVVPAWTLRMIQIQIALVYLVSGLWKVVAPSWMDGTALVYALGNHTFSRLGMPDWVWLQPLFAAATLAVAWWEFLFPVLALGSRTRRWSLAFGVALHLGILAFMYVGIFPLIMLGCYPAFLKAGEARWLVGRVRALLPGGYAREATSASAASRVAS